MEGEHHHFRPHGPIKCPNCQKELPKPEHPKGPPKEGEIRKPPTCPFCGKEFPRPPPLKCKKCGEELHFPHGPPPEIVCPKCGEKFEFPRPPKKEE